MFSLPSLPDNFHKFLLVAGLALTIFAITFQIKNGDLRNEIVDKKRVLNDSIDVANKVSNHRKERLLKSADLLSTKYGVVNPLTDRDSAIHIKWSIVSDNPTEVMVHDSIHRLFDAWVEENFVTDLEAIKRNSRLEYLDEKYDEYDQIHDEMNYYAGLGLIFIFIGIFGFITFTERQSLQQKIQIQLLQRDLNIKAKYYEWCQSCGRKFNSILTHGSEQDGNKSNAFCKCCYQDGEFVKKDQTLSELLSELEPEINQYNKFMSQAIIERIKNLDRWKKKHF